MQGKIAKWWMPDDVVFVDEIPHTATGKIQKLTLREQFKDYGCRRCRRRSEGDDNSRLWPREDMTTVIVLGIPACATHHRRA